jgi:hypothetical protein
MGAGSAGAIGGLPTALKVGCGAKVERRRNLAGDFRELPRALEVELVMADAATESRSGG